MGESAEYLTFAKLKAFLKARIRTLEVLGFTKFSVETKSIMASRQSSIRGSTFSSSRFIICLSLLPIRTSNLSMREVQSFKLL